MTINPVSSVYDAYKPNKITNVARANQVASKQDVFTISQTAKDFQSALKAVANSPDIRESKVESIKSKIDSNSYSVKSDAIADKLLSSAFSFSV